MSSETHQPDSELRSRLQAIRDRLKPALKEAQEKVESKEEIIEEVVRMMAGNQTLKAERLNDSYRYEEINAQFKREQEARIRALAPEKARELADLQEQEQTDRAEINTLVNEIAILPAEEKVKAMAEIEGEGGVLKEVERKYRELRAEVEQKYRVKEEEIRAIIKVSESLDKGNTLSDPNTVIDLVLRSHLYTKEMEKLGGPDVENAVDDKVHKSTIDGVAQELGISETDLSHIRETVWQRINLGGGLDKEAEKVGKERKLITARKEYEEKKEDMEDYFTKCEAFLEGLSGEIRGILNEFELLYQTGEQNLDAFSRGLEGQRIRAILELPDKKGKWPFIVDNTGQKKEAKEMLVRKRKQIMDAYDEGYASLAEKRRKLKDEKIDKMQDDVNISNFLGFASSSLNLFNLSHKIKEAGMPEAKEIQARIEKINKGIKSVHGSYFTMFNIMAGRERVGRDYKKNREELLKLINITFNLDTTE